jgi:hypothetical protein
MQFVATTYHRMIFAGQNGIFGAVSGESLGEGKSHKPKVRETRES